MNIHILGAHNCESEGSRFVCLLVDDILAIDAGTLTSKLSFEAQQNLKAILLTHHHYDHIRDVPAIAINHLYHHSTIEIFSTKSVRDYLTTHIMNDRLYPNFLELPEKAPILKFTVIEPFKQKQIEDYKVLAVPVNHDSVTVGYQITSTDGKSVFYTADTGPGLDACWEHISPQLLIIDVTMPNSHQEFAIQSQHLTPALLSYELIKFREDKDYLPQVVVVHMNPAEENKIYTEITAVAKELNTPITLAYEGMQLHL